MKPNSPHTKHLFLSALLRAWEASEHRLGIGAYFQIQKLLQILPDDVDLAKLKTQLSPILVHNKEQQQDFYELFDKTLIEIKDFEEEEIEEQDELVETKKPSISNKLWWIIGFVVLISLASIPFIFKTSTTSGQKKVEIEQSNAITTEKKDTSTANQTIKVNTSDSTEANTKEPLQLKRFQHNPDISTLIPKEEWHFGRQYAYMSPLKWLILGVLAFSIWLLAWWLNRRRQKLILNYKPNDKPPYLWTLTIANIENVAFDEDFNRLNNQLRRQTNAETQRLDINNTIKATILRGGIVDFKYRQLKRGNEYLVLIDMHSPQNHRAQLFNFLYKTFNENDVPVERFFYDGDMRLCWNEQHKRGVSIRELQSKYPEHRLIVFGSAMSLLSPTTGRLESWTSALDSWRIKALLTPRPINDWDIREETLAAKFRILPSTLRGIGELIETLEASEAKDYRLWQTLNNTDDTPLQFSENLKPENIIALLEAEFCPYNKGKTDDRLLQWIAACAVSPILHWDWTLHVASQIHNSEELLSLNNLFKINRLSWFVAGKIPDKIRIALLDWLEKTHPTVTKQVREEWQKVLDENTPPPDSLAFEDHKLQSLFNQLQLNAPNRQQILKDIEKLLPFHEDALIVEYLKREPTALDVFVPQRFRKFVRNTEGYLPRVKDWVWQVPLIVLLALGIYFYSPIAERCNGVKVIYNHTKYCLSSPQDSLIVWEYLICDTIISGTNSKLFSSYSFPIVRPAETVGTDIIFDDEKRFMEDYMISEGQKLIRANNLDSSSFYKNIAIAYYNTAVNFYNTRNKDKACLYLGKLDKWRWKDSVLTQTEIQWVNKVCLNNAPIRQDTQVNRTTQLRQDTQQIVQKLPALKDSVAAPKIDSTNSINIDMIKVKGGNFKGAVINDFSIGKYEVTVAQYLQFLDETKNKERYPEWDIEKGNHSDYNYEGYSRKSLKLPMVGIDLDDVNGFCEWLSKKSGKKYRLPTEREWEYAAKGGTTSQNFTYSGSNDINSVAWFGNPNDKSSPVGTKSPNELGIYDMSGNVWERCSGDVIRGGGWDSDPKRCTIESRMTSGSTNRNNNLGFRVVQQ